MQIVIKDDAGKVVKTVTVEGPVVPLPDHYHTLKALFNTIEANLTNERLSDKGFRQFIRNSVQGVLYRDEESKAKSG